MFGLMQDRPLMISSLIEYAATFHPGSEIVSRLPEGSIRRSNWAEVRDRSKQVANALSELGPAFIKFGQVLASRPDLLSPAWTEELQKLHSQVVPVAWEQSLPQMCQ